MASECAYAEELYDLVPIQVIQWINVVTSISSIVLVSYTASNYLHRTIFEKVTKELIIALYAFISVFSVCIILTQVLSSITFGVLAYSLAGRFAYCSGFTANSEELAMFVFVLDILNSLALLFLWKYKKRSHINEQSYDQARTFHRRQNLYAMQQFLPIATLHAILYAVFFFTVYFSQSLKSSMTPGWYIFVAAVANASYDIISHYCFLCPLIFLFLIRRGRFKRVSHIKSMVNPEKDPNDVSLQRLSAAMWLHKMFIYFSALKDQWK